MSPVTQNRLKILFVDDEAPIREVMQNELPRMGHEVTICADGESALKALDQHVFDVAMIDLRMPGLSGWDVVDHIKRVAPDTEIIICTGHGNLEAAVQAIRKGAYDFLTKPTKLVTIANVLRRVNDKRMMTNKTIALETRLKKVEGTTDLIGSTTSMQKVKQLIDKIAATDSAVMILGETGTGKELVARRIHEKSHRAHMPFVAVNCGALPENLVESEFFGHKKGAFTGADSHRKGLLEVANGGTLFLDELGELDKTMQVKLLRFLESGEVRRIGENDSFHVDVRIVCATNRDLQEMVRHGDFREDLFFRVNTFEMQLPPLRERKDDIPAIARSLVARHMKRASVPDDILAPETLRALKSYEWSGNVREMANALEHAVILSGGNTIMPDDLPGHITGLQTPRRESMTMSSDASVDKTQTLREIEMQVIYRVLSKYNGDKPKAANELGIALKTLYNKLNQYEAQSMAG